MHQELAQLTPLKQQVRGVSRVLFLRFRFRAGPRGGGPRASADCITAKLGLRLSSEGPHVPRRTAFAVRREHEWHHHIVAPWHCCSALATTATRSSPGEGRAAPYDDDACTPRGGSRVHAYGG